METMTAPDTTKREDRRSRITGKLKTALNLMVWGGEDGTPLDFADAARSANYRVRSMRKALEKPHVRQYLRTQRDLFRTSISARVIFRLDELSRQNTNMAAAVAASRAILQLDDEAAMRPAIQQVPGLTIVVMPAAPCVPPVDVTPRPAIPAPWREAPETPAGRFWINGRDEPVTPGVFRHPFDCDR
jgi:hypothetical protein